MKISHASSRSDSCGMLVPFVVTDPVNGCWNNVFDRDSRFAMQHRVLLLLNDLAYTMIIYVCNICSLSVTSCVPAHDV